MRGWALDAVSPRSNDRSIGLCMCTYVAPYNGHEAEDERGRSFGRASRSVGELRIPLLAYLRRTKRMRRISLWAEPPRGHRCHPLSPIVE